MIRISEIPCDEYVHIRPASPELRSLLNCDLLQRFREPAFSNLYISNAHIEQHLANVVQSQVSSFDIFVGGPGIGKSTYIRKIVGVSNIPVILDETLVIPLFCNLWAAKTDMAGHVLPNEINKKIENELNNAVGVLESISPNPFNVDEFEEFLRSRLGHVYGLAEAPTVKAIALRLQNRNPEQYWLSRIFFNIRNSLASNPRPIRKIHFLLDDIETYDFTSQTRIVKSVARLVQSCASYIGSLDHSIDLAEPNTLPSFYGISLLASIRPITYDNIRDDDLLWAAKTTVFKIEDAVPNSMLLDSNFKYYSARHHSDSLTKEYSLLKKIIDGFTYKADSTSTARKKFVDVLMQLCNNNIRDAMMCLINLACFYAPDNYDAFFADGPSEARVIRDYALLNESKKFKHFVHNSTMIPNIMDDVHIDTFGLLTYYTCALFRKNEAHSFARPICERDLSEELGLIFRNINNEPRFLSRAISRLSECAIIRSDEAQKGDTRKWYAMPKLFAIFKLMESSSVILELWRDDMVFIENTAEGKARAIRIFDIADPLQRILHAIETAKQISAQEVHLFANITKAKKIEIINVFGRPATERFHSGLQRSYRKLSSVYGSDSKIENALNDLSKMAHLLQS